MFFCGWGSCAGCRVRGFFMGVGSYFDASLLGECALAGRLVEQVAEHAVPQFRFKPRAFWWQDAALVGDGYQVGDAEGMQGKGDAVWGFVR